MGGKCKAFDREAGVSVRQRTRKGHGAGWVGYRTEIPSKTADDRRVSIAMQRSNQNRRRMPSPTMLPASAARTPCSKPSASRVQLRMPMRI